MEILHRLPEGNHLNKTKFKQNTKNEDQLLLTLGVGHSVDSKMCDVYRGGEATVKYLIHVTKQSKNICDSLTIDETICPISDQSADEVKAVLNSIRPKSGHDVSAYEQHSFDLRAFSYTLGAAIGKSVAGIELDLTPGNTIKAKTLANAWNNPSAGDLMLSPSVIKNSKEWATFACLAGMAGIRTVTYMNDTLPASTNQLIFEDLASFCFKLQAIVLSVADSCGSASHHELAFFRGLTASMKLHSHSDEGGWVRDVLTRASYPRPRGILTALVGSIGGLPTHRYILPSETTRYAVAYLLRGSAIIAAVDGDKELMLPTILRTDGDSRPGGVDELQGRLYENWSKWRSAVASLHNYTYEGVGDVSSAKHYFREDKVDRHLSPDYVMPFWFIEPSLVLPDMPFALPRPVCPGKETLLPMLADVEEIYPSRTYGEVNKRPIRGGKVLISLKDWRPRNSGLSYILNSVYGEKNGLSLFSPKLDPRLPTKGSDPIFAQQEVYNMGDQRWMTPHNPLPHPGESFSMGRLLYQYSSDGSRDYPNLDDLKSGTVSSRCGDFFITSPEGFTSGRTCRAIPEKLRFFFETRVMGAYETVMDCEMDFIGLPDGVLRTDPPPPQTLQRTEVLAAPSGISLGSDDPDLRYIPVHLTPDEVDFSQARLIGPSSGVDFAEGPVSRSGRTIAIRGDDEPGIAPRPPQSEAKPPNGSD